MSRYEECTLKIGLISLDPVHDPKKNNSEWTQFRMNTIPNGHHPKWTPSQTEQSQMDTIPNRHNSESSQSQIVTYIYILIRCFIGIA